MRLILIGISLLLVLFVANACAGTEQSKELPAKSDGSLILNSDEVKRIILYVDDVKQPIGKLEEDASVRDFVETLKAAEKVPSDLIFIQQFHYFIDLYYSSGERLSLSFNKGDGTVFNISNDEQTYQVAADKVEQFRALIEQAKAQVNAPFTP